MGFYTISTSLGPEWFHMVIVYRNGGFTVHHVGTFQETDSTVGDRNHTLSPGGRMIIGRKSVDTNNFYTSIIVDELTLWERTLTNQEIQDMYSSEH